MPVLAGRILTMDVMACQKRITRTRQEPETSLGIDEIPGIPTRSSFEMIPDGSLVAKCKQAG